jgi:hypothetical protein
MLEAWPKSFEASRPTDDNIALYFLACKMRCLAYSLIYNRIASYLFHYLESNSSDFYR